MSYSLVQYFPDGAIFYTEKQLQFWESHLLEKREFCCASHGAEGWVTCIQKVPDLKLVLELYLNQLDFRCFPQ
jgi:hypothetical protein